MGRIINLQVPCDEGGNMPFTVQEMQHMMNAYKELFPNDEIIMSPFRLVPTDEQFNIELSEKLIAANEEIYRDYLLCGFLEQAGVDNWDPGYSIARGMLDHYLEHGNLDTFEDKF